MREHNQRRRKRSFSPEDSNLVPSDGRHKVHIGEGRSSSPSSSEREREVTRKERHRHGHKRHTSHREKNQPEDDVHSRSTARQREDGRMDRERKRERSHVKEKQKDLENSLAKVKEEPVYSDDDRVQPSSSKWDDDDQSNKISAPRDKRRHGINGDNRELGRHRQAFGDRRKQGPFKRPFIQKEAEDTSGMEWGKKQNNGDEKSLPAGEKEKPNFGLSGKLTEDTNTYKGVVIKYSEPPEARIPKRRWRLYPFKGEEALKVLHIHRASAFLLGRDRKVVDIPLDHPSCSKQHAALQYRLVQYTRDNGSVGKRIRPYIIDLESANGTYVNNNKVEPKKYVELLERDVLKFGFSSREYVLLHEHSQDDDDDNL